ncbi:hypothetical protein EV361DRAFT_1002722 [Lentinula raphanica]|nr:hypothetical protein EV361DRAFT_1002722 [Lentinula raphanica]
MSCCDNPQILWDADTCINVCTSCGDAVEHALVVPSEFEFSIGSQTVGLNSRQTSIKSKHGPAQHTLKGESSEHKAKRLTVEMHKFIGSLCTQMSSPNLDARVCLLFDQSMKNEVTKFRWGGQAKAVSGACLAIALRENNKPDRLKEIALILGQKYVYLQRTLATLLASLKIKLPLTTPSHHIPNLVSHLYQELKLRPEESILSIKLYSQLQNIPLQSVAELSCTFLETFALTSNSKFIQSSSTSCAVSAFVLCLEGELGKSLFDIKDIFKCFSQVCHLSADTLSRPYRTMRQEVLDWMKKLNWEEQYKKRSNGRADSSLRNVCARSLKDALREVDQKWRLEQRKKPGKYRLKFALDDGLDSGEESSDENHCPRGGSENLPFRSKNKKADNCLLDGASFLLNPFHHVPQGVIAPTTYPRADWSSIPETQAASPVSELPLRDITFSSNSASSTTASKSKPVPPIESSSYFKKPNRVLDNGFDQFSTDPQPCDYMNYLLSNNEPLLAIRASIHDRATRMSLQTATLGAADPEAIPDEDLVTNEEWKALQRTTEEQEQLQNFWDNVPGLMDRMEQNAERAKKRKYEHLSNRNGGDEADLLAISGVGDVKKLRFMDAGELDMDLGHNSVDEGDVFEQSLGLDMDMKTIMNFFSGDVDADEQVE